MSQTFMVADLHFGHKNIIKFRNWLGFDEEIEHREYIIKKWNSSINKNDTIYILGDAVFYQHALADIGRLNGSKILVRGNHDQCKTEEYLKYFVDIFGIINYKGTWLSHAPLHPNELRGKISIHGHVHSDTIRDPDGSPSPLYRNVSLENIIDFQPVEFSVLINTPENCLKEYPCIQKEKQLIEEYKMMKRGESNGNF